MKRTFLLMISLIFAIASINGCSGPRDGRGWTLRDAVTYPGWWDVTCPTDTKYKATMELPIGWEFKTKDGIITIEEQETGKIIAEQIFQGWDRIREKGSVEYLFADNWDNMQFNKNIPYDIHVKEYYDMRIGSSSSAYIYTFDDGTVQKDCLVLGIVQTLNVGYYSLYMIFHVDLEDKVYKVMLNSYHFGGSYQEY